MEEPREEDDEREGFKYVPEEIVQNVLANLHLEPLLRFRCVSKHWSYQISKHITKTKVKKVIVHTDQTSVFRSVDQNTRVEDIEIEVDQTITRDNPDVSPHIYGSCNEFALIRAGIYLFLWNPSTRRSHGMLTYRHLMQYPRDRVIPGLCFDSVKDEYKVVLGLNHRNWRERSVWVAGFKTKTWSRLDINFNVRLFKSGPTVNNYLHWWSSKEIVAFDPNIDKFTKISLPKENCNGEGVIYGLGALDGCLCIVNDQFLLYTRKQCSGSVSWELNFSFNPGYGSDRYYPRSWSDLAYITPLFFIDEQNCRALMRLRRTTYEQKYYISYDYQEPQLMSDEYAIIAYSVDLEGDLPKDIAVSSFEKIAYDGVVVYEETVVRPVSMCAHTTSKSGFIPEEAPGGGKKVWKLKMSEAKVEDGEGENLVITSVEGSWKGRRRMRRGKKSTAAAVSTPADQFLSITNAFDILNDDE